MEISNKKRARRIKKVFNLGAVLLLPILFFVWKEMDLAAAISGGVLLLFIFTFQFAGLNYIHYLSDGEKLQIRYYPIISFFGKEYSSIELNKKMLYKAEIKKSFLFYDLNVEVKLKKGVAEYPSLSLSALSKNDIHTIQTDLEGIIQKNSSC